MIPARLDLSLDTIAGKWESISVYKSWDNMQWKPRCMEKWRLDGIG